MNYAYENLGDERFQEFCHCLISKEFPNSQAFPVGQPDGGRDSIAYISDTINKEFIVFQVKFVRDPNKKEPHKWLVDTVEKEIKKIDKLIPKGAVGYYLITNVNGTAHLDAGSIDKLNKVLEENISIPSLCWWRDDISRLMEKDPLFKWSYPEVLSGQDILNSVLFNNLNENKERRENVIRAYLADQYNMDNEVKFRQIDLQNRLLDLFTDVPIRAKKFNKKNKQLRQIFETLNEHEMKRITSINSVDHDEYESIGAAEFLLHSKVQGTIERILLEGGPGQGKSTISQYISQVHRVRLLNNKSDKVVLPDVIKNSPVRFPFKIDLRHVASWVENINPYQSVLNDEYFKEIWKNSLEAFMVAHIINHSSIENFDTNDFIAICKISPVLFVFDGFDEIANLKIRENVISFINKGINRIKENSESIQVIITSRPAVFSDSLGFSVDMYPHFELTDITPTVTKEYVGKWVKANRLNSKDASEIKRLVNDKLKLPHLKELAKSPMQLAIFISLLRTKGESLPNKRTSLYDSYVELLFDRESEKSSMIRDNRDLIIDIHEYLGWILHSEAELYKNSGSIQVDDLKIRLNEYLESEGHKTDIADKLFDVVKDRVCALASRVQGTYEFEVQPLREYFCAKYLYKTSPYSPAGAEKQGTLPDRFEAISKIFYWQNVVRFFAGCFSKGELSMLIQKLKELENDDVLRYTNYPRIIASQLLADYVFTQYPIHLKEVVSIIINGINIGNIINQDEESPTNDSILLPTDCGRVEIIYECFENLNKFPSIEYASELINLAKNNPLNNLDMWLNYSSKFKDRELTTWLEYAYRLEILHKIDDKYLIDIIREGGLQETIKRMQIAIGGGRFDLIEKNLDLKEICFNEILDSNMGIHHRKDSHASLQFLTYVFHPMILYRIFDMNRERFSYDSLVSRYLYRKPRSSNKNIYDFIVNDDTDKKISNFSDKIKPALAMKLSNWATTLEPWEMVIEEGRKIFGDKWKFIIMANIAAGIKSKDEMCEEYDDLSNQSMSLCKRVRFARFKSGNIKFWNLQFENNIDLKLKLLVFFTWATPKTIFKLYPIVSPIIDSLEADDLHQLTSGVYGSTHDRYFSKPQKEFIFSKVEEEIQSDVFKYFISLRIDAQSRNKFVYENITSNPKFIEEIAEAKLCYLVDEYLSNPSDVRMLNRIKSLYAESTLYKMNSYYLHHLSRKNITIPFDMAKKIMSDCKSYPKRISMMAEKSCRLNAYDSFKAVGETAKTDKWFE